LSTDFLVESPQGKGISDRKSAAREEPGLITFFGTNADPSSAQVLGLHCLNPDYWPPVG